MMLKAVAFPEGVPESLKGREPVSVPLMFKKEIVGHSIIDWENNMVYIFIE